MKRVLIITYYWPPSGGGGVQRWLKFVKYIRKFGWEPVIFTPSNGESPVLDKSLMNEIPPNVETIKNSIWEPYKIYKLLTGKQKKQRVYSGFINDKKVGVLQKLSVFIRGNFFIPDARKFWIKPSIRFLEQRLEALNIDLIISTGPPHSTHLIANGLKLKYPIPWIADFRDPWTKIDFYDQLRLTKWGDKMHKKLELNVLENADRIVTVSDSWAEDFKEISNREDIAVITNGYDEADFVGIKPDLDKSFSICHVGSMNKDRNPVILWQALSELIDDKQFEAKLEIKLIGQIDYSVKQSISQMGLEKYLRHIPQLPHKEAISELRKSQLLLLPINNTPNVSGVIPGKLFEYLGAKRPILCIGPSGSDSTKIISKTNAGEIFGYTDTLKIKDAILTHFNSYSNGELSVSAGDTKQYTRENLIGSYCQIMDTLVSK